MLACAFPERACSRRSIAHSGCGSELPWLAQRQAAALQGSVEESGLNCFSTQVQDGEFTCAFLERASLASAAASRHAPREPMLLATLR